MLTDLLDHRQGGFPECHLLIRDFDGNLGISFGYVGQKEGISVFISRFTIAIFGSSLKGVGRG